MMSKHETRPRQTPMNRQIVGRLLLGGLTVLSTIRAFLDPGSPAFSLADGSTGNIVLLAMGALGLLAIIDAIVNDILPDRCVLHGAVTGRHLIWASLGCLYCGCAFVLSQSEWPWGTGGASANFVILGIACMCVGYLDLRYRARDAHLDRTK